MFSDICNACVCTLCVWLLIWSTARFCLDYHPTSLNLICPASALLKTISALKVDTHHCFNDAVSDLTTFPVMWLGKHFLSQFSNCLVTLFTHCTVLITSAKSGFLLSEIIKEARQVWLAEEDCCWNSNHTTSRRRELAIAWICQKLVLQSVFLFRSLLGMISSIGCCSRNSLLTWLRTSATLDCWDRGLRIEDPGWKGGSRIRIRWLGEQGRPERKGTGAGF